MAGEITTTSFIPKTRLTAPATYRRKGFGMGFLISFLLLLISGGLFAGAYLYKQSLQKSVDDDVASLKLALESIEPKLIDEFGQLASSVNTAKILFGQHTASSKIFKLISDYTLKNVRFLNFDFKTVDENPVVIMNGEANSYTDIALQSRLFEENDAVSQVTFSKFVLKEGGKVSFSVEIVLNPSSVTYSP
jgi:hypothetical protein